MPMIRVASKQTYPTKMSKNPIQDFLYLKFNVMLLSDQKMYTTRSWGSSNLGQPLKLSSNLQLWTYYRFLFLMTLLTNFKHFKSTVLQSKSSISRILFKISANKIRFVFLNQSKSLQVSEINLKLSDELLFFLDKLSWR